MRVATAMVAAVLASSMAATASADAPGPAEGWRFELQPYLWVPMQVTGDATVPAIRPDAQPRTVDVDATVDELFDVLQFAGMLRAELWWDRIGLVYDGAYLQTEADTTVAGQGVGLTNRLLLQDVFLRARFLQWSFGDVPEDMRLAIELDTGIRTSWLWVDADIGPTSVERNELDTKALLGLQVPFRISSSWLVMARGMVAAPGPSWQAAAVAQWDATDLLALKLGYRVDGYDTGASNINFEVIAHGPYLGLGFRFGGRVF